MKTVTQSPSPSPDGGTSRFWRRVAGAAVFLVWLAAAAGTVYFFARGGALGEVPGYVETPLWTAAPRETGRLQDVFAAPGQAVKAGQALARMDTSLLDAEAGLKRLQIEQRFARAIFQAEKTLQEAQIEQISDTAELDVLNREMLRLARYAEPRVMDDARRLAELQARQRALGGIVEIRPKTIQSIEKYLEQARAYQSDLAGSLGRESAAPLPSVGDEGTAVRLEEDQLTLGLLRLRRESYTLKAEKDGIVSEVLRRPGEVILAGEAVISLIIDTPPRVVALVPAAAAGRISIGDPAWVTPRDGKGRTILARVEALAPNVIGPDGPLPAYRPEIGNIRRGFLTIPDDARENLLPGETVSVRFSEPWWRKPAGWLGEWLPPLRDRPR